MGVLNDICCFDKNCSACDAVLLMKDMVLFQTHVSYLYCMYTNTCGGRSACHFLMVPTVDHDSKLCCRVN